MAPKESILSQYCPTVYHFQKHNYEATLCFPLHFTESLKSLKKYSLQSILIYILQIVSIWYLKYHIFMEWYFYGIKIPYFYAHEKKKIVKVCYVIWILLGERMAFGWIVITFLFFMDILTNIKSPSVVQWRYHLKTLRMILWVLWVE